MWILLLQKLLSLNAVPLVNIIYPIHFIFLEMTPEIGTTCVLVSVAKDDRLLNNKSKETSFAVSQRVAQRSDN